MLSVPTTFEYVAEMTAVPLPTAVTTPDAETVAAKGLDDDHVAALVTSCAEPLDSVAVAVNCDVAPADGMVPVTLNEETVLADVAESLLHAPTHSASATAITDAVIIRNIIICLL
jgi:hypothetical protein